MQIFSRPGHVIRSGPGRDAVARGDAIADGLTTEQAARANATLVQAVERFGWTTVMGQAPHADRAAITTPTPFAA